MGQRYLLDTNICIYIRQRRSAQVLARFSKLKAGEAAISVLTFGELRYGAERSAQRERALAILGELTAYLPVLDMPARAGAAYGEIRSELERAGKSIGNNDLWIAAHARAVGLVLVTNNEREFRRVDGLKIENWI